MSVLYIRNKDTGKFEPVKTIRGAQGPMGTIEGLEYYDDAPNASGTASPGTSEAVARGDHAHPLPPASAFLDILHPIGSIYMSVNATSPADIYGGTWEQIKDRFLLAAGDAYAAGKTGGAAEVSLTLEQMPKHNHEVRRESSTGTVEFTSTTAVSAVPSNTDVTGVKRYTTYAGEGEAHNNMPPYLAVYIWQRTA